MNCAYRSFTIPFHYERTIGNIIYSKTLDKSDMINIASIVIQGFHS